MASLLLRQGRVEDVRLHGALGDGISDDTIAIQRASDTAESAGGGTVFLPPSSSAYRYTKVNLGSNVWLAGDPLGGTCLKCADDLNVSTGVAYGIGAKDGATQVGIANLEIDGNAEALRGSWDGSVLYGVLRANNLNFGANFADRGSAITPPARVYLHNIYSHDAVRNCLVSGGTGDDADLGSVTQTVVVSGYCRLVNSDADHLLYVSNVGGVRFIADSIILEGFARGAWATLESAQVNSIMLQNAAVNPTSTYAHLIERIIEIRGKGTAGPVPVRIGSLHVLDFDPTVSNTQIAVLGWQGDVSVEELYYRQYDAVAHGGSMDTSIPVRLIYADGTISGQGSPISGCVDRIRAENVMADTLRVFRSALAFKSFEIGGGSSIKYHGSTSNETNVFAFQLQRTGHLTVDGMTFTGAGQAVFKTNGSDSLPAHGDFRNIYMADGLYASGAFDLDAASTSNAHFRHCVFGSSGHSTTMSTTTRNHTRMDDVLVGGSKMNGQGTATFSGDGVTTAFTITHGLTYGTLNWYEVTPTSAAAGATRSLSTGTGTIVVTFTVAPVLGTNNITFNWYASVNPRTLLS